MKIVNTILLIAFLFLFLPGISLTSSGKSELILIWLISIPAMSLFALTRKACNKKTQFLMAVGVFYNGISAAMLILYAMGMNVSESHPVAFAIMEQLYSFWMAAIAVVNTVVIGKKLRNDIAFNKANSADAPASSG